MPKFTKEKPRFNQRKEGLLRPNQRRNEKKPKRPYIKSKKRSRKLNLTRKPRIA